MSKKLMMIICVFIMLSAAAGTGALLFSQEEAVTDEDIEGEGIAAVLSAIEGDVELLGSGEEEWKKASQGQVINAGDKIRTAGNSAVEIEFESGALGSLEGNSEMGIKSAISDYDNDEYETSLELTLGKVLVNVGRVGNEGVKFNVETPIAVAAVRGTEFMVDASSPEDTDVAAFSGKVRVSKKGLPGFVTVGKNKRIKLKKDKMKLRKPVKIGKHDKVFKFKKKFVKLKKKAITFRKKKLKLKRKKIKLRHKNIKLKKKEKVKNRKGKLDTKKQQKVKPRKNSEMKLKRK